MKRLSVFVLLFISMIIPTHGDSERVLICKSPNSYAYHKGFCAAMNRCSYEYEWVSLSQAKSFGKWKACGYCYK